MLRFRFLALSVVAASLVGGASSLRADELPAAASRPVSFERDVMPLLESHCAKCHLGGKRRGGLRLDTPELALAGGESGAAVVPGKSESSRLVRYVAGLEEKIMPPKGDRLGADEIAVLRAWIDVELARAYPDGIHAGASLARASRALRPARTPELPPIEGAASANPIDRILAPYFREHAVDVSRSIDERLFARRVSLDVLGVLPRPAEIDALLKDEHEDRRARFVERLLERRAAYAQHWLTFWNDALRNDYRGTGYIDGGRKQITDWLLRSLEENIPFDRFVRELLSPSAESEGFIKGIVWRGTVNASQVPAMQAAQNVAQVFLGLNLKCASCHDSFINDWKLADAYAFANVFSDSPLEIHRCDQPTGETASTAFLWPELGEIPADLPRAKRLERLAEIVTRPENARLARTIVNRLWARFFGRGLVEPVDEMERAPWSVDLLDWLAADLVANGWDLKQTIARMLTSRAYQMPSVGAVERHSASDFVFRGPEVRRLSAEQFVDAMSALTGGSSVAPASFVRAVTGVVEAPADDAHGEHEFTRFRSGVMRSGAKEVDVDVAGAETLWLVVLDGGDGGNHDWADWGEPRFVDAKGAETRLTDLKWLTAEDPRKPRLNKNTVDHALRVDGRELEYGIGAHAQSFLSYAIPPGTTRFRAIVGPDQEAVDAGGENGHSIEFLVLVDVYFRSSLGNSDELTRALGRPNREQVVTRRDAFATTLQALELTNGETLDTMLKRGAEAWLERELAPAPLVEAIWERALGRPPSSAETETARALLGDPVSAEGLSDLLWALAMHPELQLIQ